MTDPLASSLMVERKNQQNSTGIRIVDHGSITVTAQHPFYFNGF